MHTNLLKFKFIFCFAQGSMLGLGGKILSDLSS